VTRLTALPQEQTTKSKENPTGWCPGKAHNIDLLLFLVVYKTVHFLWFTLFFVFRRLTMYARS
jgi:hypothetical protein